MCGTMETNAHNSVNSVNMKGSMVVDVDLVGYFLKLNCSTQVWTILFGIEYKYDIIGVKRLDTCTCSHAKTKSCVMFG